MAESAQGGGEAVDPRELHELKEQAAKYYEENKVPERMEEILNSMFYDNPKDVYGHVANYFEGFALPPVISKLQAREALDGRGQTTVQTEVFCTVKNKERRAATSIVSNECHPHDSVKPEEKDTAEEERQKFVEAAIEFINGDVSSAIAAGSVQPTDQQKVDDLLTDTVAKLKEEQAESARKAAEEEAEKEGGDSQSISAPSPKPPSDSPKKGKSPKGKKKGGDVIIIPDEPREEFFCGCNAISGVSQAVAEAAANVKDAPLYRHLAQLRFCELSPEAEFHLPIPMVTIMTCGKLAPGKLNCVKEYMVMPKPGMSMKDAVRHINGIYAHCAKSLSAKTGIVSRNVTDAGSLMPSFDRAEQGLDLLQDAMTQLELTPGEDFHIAINCAGHEIFDYEKGKYEVTAGQQKAGEDMADFWGDITTRYPSVLALIDPLRKQEKDGWMKLCERVSEKCYVIGDMVYHRPGLLKDEDLDPYLKTSAISIKLEQMNTITDIMSVCKKMEDADNQIVVSCNVGETPDSFAADLAVGIGARFLKLGGATRGERVSKLNRLLQIEAELSASSSLVTWGEHVFPSIRPPTPAPEGEEGADAGGEGEASEAGGGSSEEKSQKGSEVTKSETQSEEK